MKTAHMGISSVNATLLLFLASFLAGAGWIFSIHALEGLPPLLFIGSRFFLAGVAVAATTGHLRSLIDRRFFFQILPGALFFALSMICWTQGLAQTTSPGVSAFISSTSNLMVPFLGVMLFGWAFYRSTAIAIALAAIGLACLFLGPGARVEMAHLYFTVAALLLAFGLALVKNRLNSLNAMQTTSGFLFFAGIIILSAAFPVEGLPDQMPGLETWGWFAASLVLCTYVRFILQFAGQQRVSLAKAGLIMSLEPVWVLGLSILVFEERPGLAQAAGCALVMTAILYENRQDRRRSAIGVTG
ncbi:DMT family transporter [Cohaesibacter sp. CAU 1516]|uniref:DMT family transporter n=1 Tax=Cohaesibacter sp. CAU 1516 TaxID=2576038 RepID=UPI001484DC28|nr:DMT family transporter [Cohaesibacter sp. CAU 1516]